MRTLTLPAIILTALTVAACGGDSTPPPTEPAPTIASGVFKDSNVSGLTYVSGSQTGVTGADGSFTFEEGKPATFYVGNVKIGEAIGASVVTPINLVTYASSNSPQVLNIVRFLMMLDFDADATNGIQISSAVQTNATTWAQIDFRNIDKDDNGNPVPLFQDRISNLVTAVSVLDGRTASLPDAATAQAHIESTFGCIYAGVYQGTFTGGVQGTVGFQVDANRRVNVIAYSQGFVVPPYTNNYITLTGNNATHPSFFAITGSYLPAFTSGRLDVDDIDIDADTTELETTYNGLFSTPDVLAGSWQNNVNGTQGGFTANRVSGSDPTTIYRFSTRYVSTTGNVDIGLFSFDIDDATPTSNVTGTAYSVVSGVQSTLSGTLNTLTNTLTATTTNGISITATGVIPGSGALAGGTWSGVGSSGNLTSGSGCRLN